MYIHYNAEAVVGYVYIYLLCIILLIYDTVVNIYVFWH